MGLLKDLQGREVHVGNITSCLAGKIVDYDNDKWLAAITFMNAAGLDLSQLVEEKVAQSQFESMLKFAFINPILPIVMNELGEDERSWFSDLAGLDSSSWGEEHIQLFLDTYMHSVIWAYDNPNSDTALRVNFSYPQIPSLTRAIQERVMPPWLEMSSIMFQILLEFDTSKKSPILISEEIASKIFNLLNGRDNRKNVALYSTTVYQFKSYVFFQMRETHKRFLSSEEIFEVWWDAKFGSLGRIATLPFCICFLPVSFLLMLRAQRRAESGKS